MRHYYSIFSPRSSISTYFHHARVRSSKPRNIQSIAMLCEKKTFFFKISSTRITDFRDSIPPPIPSFIPSANERECSTHIEYCLSLTSPLPSPQSLYFSTALFFSFIFSTRFLKIPSPSGNAAGKREVKLFDVFFLPPHFASPNTSFTHPIVSHFAIAFAIFHFHWASSDTTRWCDGASSVDVSIST